MTGARGYRPAALALAIAFAGIYTMTASRTVVLAHDDAAEFQTIGVVGGIPHQPYPLWCMLARCAALLPVGEPAWRITLLSILFGVATVLLVFALAVRWTKSTSAGVIASLAVGLSMSFWRNAVVAEVYTMNACMLALLIHVGDRWITTGGRRYWYLSWLMLGLLLSHHQLNLAILPPAALVLYWQRHRITALPLRARVAGLLTLALPISLYLHTYVVDRTGQPVNWYDNYGRYLYASQGGDITHFDTSFMVRLWFQMFVGRLGPLLPSTGALITRVWLWLRDFAVFELPFVGSLLAVAGFVAAARTHQRVVVASLAYVVPVLFLALTVGDGVTRHTYSIPIIIVLSLYAAFAASLIRGVESVRRWTTAVLAVGLVFCSLGQLASHPRRPGEVARALLTGRGVDTAFWHLESSNDDGDRYGRELARVVPSGSLVFARWSQANVLLYHRLVRGSLDATVAYTLPNRDFMDQIIRSAQPAAVFSTVPPEEIGFRAVEEIPFGDQYSLYRIDPSTTRIGSEEK